LSCSIFFVKAVSAQRSYQELIIDYQNEILTLSAIDVDLKDVLSRLAAETNINVYFQKALQKNITIEIDGASLKDAVTRLLKGYNHIILYSGKSKKQAEVSNVIVLAKKTKRPTHSSAKARRRTNRIRSYERQIKTLKVRLSKIDANSRQGKRYAARIRNLENRVERLQQN
jgi:predicted RNase H-like nuclease (RuvC/YqgF family)